LIAQQRNPWKQPEDFKRAKVPHLAPAGIGSSTCRSPVDSLPRPSRRDWAPPVTEPSNHRSALANGMAWATRAMTVSLEMVVPGAIGIWLDRYFGTVVLFALLGFAGGLSLAIWHLVRIGNTGAGTDSSRKDPPTNAG